MPIAVQTRASARTVPRCAVIVLTATRLVLLLSGRVIAATAFPIVRDGAAIAVIKIADDATELDRTAAAELHDYIQKMTGAGLTITTSSVAAGTPVILIGLLPLPQSLRRHLSTLGEHALGRRGLGPCVAADCRP